MLALVHTSDAATGLERRTPSAASDLQLRSCDLVLQRLRACARRHRVRISCRQTHGSETPFDLRAPDLHRVTGLIRNIVPGVKPGTTLSCTVSARDGSVICHNRYVPQGTGLALSDTIDEIWSWPMHVTAWN
jgi:molybdopterin/thiamine biosynthesis adenylyltransferase